MRKLFEVLKELFRVDKKSRTGIVKQNIYFSFFLKGISILTSIIIVPLTISYLSQEEYGLWLTISSIVGWIYVFDIGLTNGLRNKLTEAFATNDNFKAKVYISTTFFLLLFIIVIVLILFCIVYQFIDWSKILNTKLIGSYKLGITVGLTIFFFSIQFVLKIVNAYYFAKQKSAINDLLIVLGSVLGLLAIFLLVHFSSSGSLMYVAIAFTALPVLVHFIAFCFTFYIKNRNLVPNIKFVDLKYSKDLIGLGLNFFVIQIAAVVLFATSNIMITQIFGPSEVTTYNIAYKYFSIITMLFSILLTPMWNAFSDAFVRKDFLWIKSSMRQLYKLWGISVIGVIFMVLLAPLMYRLWVGEKVASTIPVSLSIVCALYIIITNINSIPVFFINGVGKVKLQLYVSIFCLIFYFPIALGLSKIFGLIGIIISLIAIQTFAFLLFYYQTTRILSQEVKGVFNK
jgi:O-antigen/teichoic acid export membrane protein